VVVWTVDLRPMRSLSKSVSVRGVWSYNWQHALFVPERHEASA
jgi:hypothetical protein